MVFSNKSRNVKRSTESCDSGICRFRLLVHELVQPSFERREGVVSLERFISGVERVQVNVSGEIDQS